MDSSDSVPLFAQHILTNVFSNIWRADLIPIAGYAILFMVLIFLTGVLSSIETSFFSMSSAEKKELDKSEENKDKSIIRLMENPKSLIATILLTNLILYFLLIIVGFYLYDLIVTSQGYTYHRLVQPTIILTVIIILRLIFGEIGPKIYATQNNIKVVRNSVFLIQLLRFLLRPIVNVFLIVAVFINKKLEKYNRAALAEELDQALDHVSGQSSSQILAEKDLLKGIVNFGNIYVTQIMKARVDIIYVDTTMNFHEVLNTVRNSGYSRIPVISGDIDQTMGIIYAKDLLPYLEKDRDFDWHPLIKAAMFIPESKKIDDLLKEFKKKHVHIAIVVDEYGGTSGLVTLEDVMEEIIGEIKDEFDDIHEIDFIKIDKNNYIFEGKTGIYDACKVMEIPIDSFEEFKGEADTIAGMLLEIKGELPEENEFIDVEGFTFVAVEMNATRIVKVKITTHEA